MAEDLPNEPAAGADPTRFSAGLGSDAEDPLAAALTEGTADDAQESPPAAAPAPRGTNAGRVWISIAVATVLLILLIIFIAENSRSVTISFLGAHGHISLALALLIAAVAGAVVTLLVGTARIVQLRREVRRQRQARVADPPQAG